LLLAVTLSAGERPVPTFPVHFAGAFLRNVSWLDPSGSLSTNQLTVDVTGKKAYVNVVPQSSDFAGDYGEFWLIYAPVGAQPGTSQASSYLVFSMFKSFDDTEYCSYTTTGGWSTSYFSPPSYFPPQWISNDSISMSNWFSFPDDMVYQGPSTWRSQKVDLWSSSSTCVVFDLPPQPCTRLATTQGGNTPVAVQFSHEKHPHSFENDWISFDWWTSFSTDNIPVINPPVGPWPTKCYNAENGFEVSPVRGYVSTPFGMDNFTLTLPSNAKPISGLGPVTIHFELSGPDPPAVRIVLANGNNADGLQFTTANWNSPVRIFMKYLSDGETYFNIIATGGGYDIPYILSPNLQPSNNTKSSAMRVLTCLHGQVGYGCD